MCGIRDKAGDCTYKGVEADSPVNCVMNFESVVNRMHALKVGCCWQGFSHLCLPLAFVRGPRLAVFVACRG